ncbi:MAG: YfhO family protein [Chloroflexi bacterium]|nr:YfhO family protein [Chloroflexota bacterium]
MQRRDISGWAIMVIMGAALGGLFHRLLLGEVLFWGLPSLQFYPWRWLAFEQISNGQMPYWNPYNGAGAPLMANYQAAIVYPPNWLYIILPTAHAMGLVAILHVFWAGLGTWNLTTRLGISPLGRGISVLAFAMGSYTLARLGSFPTANTAAWIPWLFWATLNVMERRRMLDLGLLALVVGLQLLAGHAQTSWYAFLGLGLFAMWYVSGPLRPVSWRSRAKSLLLAAIGLLLGAGIAGWQLALTLEYLQQSQRASGLSYNELTNLSYAPLRAITLLLPNFFGTPADGSYLTPGRGTYFEDAAYIGVIPLVSAVFAVLGWLRWRKFLPHHPAFRSVPFWLSLSLVGFLLALGRYGPFYRFLVEYVPTFDSFRQPVRWLIWPAFGLSILAGIGVGNWNRNQRTFFWTRLAIAGAIAMIGTSLAILLVQDAIDPDTLAVFVEAFVMLGVWTIATGVLTLTQPAATGGRQRIYWQAAVLIVVAADLAWAVAGLNPTVPDDFYNRSFSVSEPASRLYWLQDYEEEVKFQQFFDLDDYTRATGRWTDVRTSLLPNLNILDRVSLLNNFDPLQPDIHRRYVDLIEEAGPGAAPLLRAAGVGRVYGEITPAGWETGPEAHTSLATASPPAYWIVPQAVWVEDDTSALALLESTDWDPEQLVILQEHSPPEQEAATAFSQAEVIIRSQEPTEHQYRVVADGAGYLVVANTWYPGWEVRVDGDEAEIYRANLAFQAVIVPAGDTDVTFSYTPRWNEAGITTSLVALFATVIIVTLGLLRGQAAMRVRGSAATIHAQAEDQEALP